MGFWDRIKGKEFNVKWEKITQKNIADWYKELDDQDVDRVFAELQDIIDSNNKKKALVKASVTILKMAGELGLKVAKG